MEIAQKIKSIINKEIKPALFRDGGNIEFVEFKKGVLKVRMAGACAGCQFSKFTLEGVEKILKEKLPEVKEVVSI